MRVITLRDFIRKQIAEFSGPRPGRRHTGDEFERKMAEQRAAFQRLDPLTATMEDMDAIRFAGFGTKASRLTCNECGEAVEVVVRFGAEEPDYDTSCEDVCAACVASALESLAAHNAHSTDAKP